jgi:hypothetical protein
VQLFGFGPRAKVHLSECAFELLATSSGCGPSLDNQQLVQVDASGEASAVFHVRGHASAGTSTLSGPGAQTFECATNCVLVATLGSGFASAMLPLSFTRPGAVAGTLIIEGGPFPGLREGIPGSVSFTRQGENSPNAVTTAETAPDGEFSVVLSYGSYVAIGKSPKVMSNNSEMTCRSPELVNVTPGNTTQAIISCDVP